MKTTLTCSPLLLHLLPVALGAVPLPLSVPKVVTSILALQVTLTYPQRGHLRSKHHILVRPLQIWPKPHYKQKNSLIFPEQKVISQILTLGTRKVCQKSNYSFQPISPKDLNEILCGKEHSFQFTTLTVPVERFPPLYRLLLSQNRT